MYSKLKDLEIDVQVYQLKVAVKKLINNIIDDTGIDIDNQSDLWSLFEQLNSEYFTSLKRNVYFADLLKSFCVSVLFDDNTCTDLIEQTEENYTLEFTLMEDNEKKLKENESEEQATPILEHIQLPVLSTKLDDLQIPDRFLKLVKRLEKATSLHTSVKIGKTLGDLMNLSASEVASLPGVGLSYVEIFDELKLLAQTAPESGLTENIVFNDEIDFTSVDTSNMRISLAGVDTKFVKALEKYARYIGVVDLNEHIDEVLKFDRHILIRLPNFGISVVDRLVEFRKLIQSEIESILAGNVNYEELESTLIVPKNISQLPLAKLEEILLDDIDTYFDRMSDDDIDIAQKRWGFIDNKQTLEEIAEGFNLTRERIRQKEVKINSNFVRHLRLGQPVLWKLLEPNLSSDISDKLEALFSCFSSEKEFYDFLSLVCNQDKLMEYVYPQLEKTVLNSYFVENGAPIHIDEIKEYLVDLELKEVRNVDNAIRYLAYQNLLSIEGEQVWPKQLGKAEASACVLVKHKKGLPWLDVAKIVNKNSYSRTPIQEERLENAAFELPDYIFLGGKGVYKHTKFIDAANISLDEIFLELMEYVESVSRDVFHLNECYHASSRLQNYDYYEIRYFVKNFGEDYGFYFDGRSQSDSVGLKKGFKNITQKDVIIETMSRNIKPLTKTQIANLLKSKSLDHASYYLDELIESGKVVQVDRMLYTTPDLAYKDINLDEYIIAINNLLKNYAKPVDPSIFKEELNLYFSNSYSKYFYSSIARLYAKKKGWFRKHNLYSSHEIPFKNLNVAFDILCNIDLTIDENISAIQAHIAINRQTAVISFSNWKISRLNKAES
jgi:hypothetical protein